MARLRFALGFVLGLAVAGVTLAVVVSERSAAATSYEDLALFSSVLRIVRDNYVDEVDESRLVRGAVRGMLAELDPHSSYLDPEAHQEMQIDTRGEFHGLGIEISKRRDGVIEVVSPIEGTPAWKAGIRPQDQIVAICPTERPADWKEPCRSTKNMDLHEAVALMRGKKGTAITIEIFREGFEKPQSFAIKRDVVKVASVDGRLLEPGYGYVRLRSFQERTAEDLRERLEKLVAENGKKPLDGLVLDLRDNPGGLLDQAVRVADTWLADGLIVYTKGRVAAQRQEFRAAPDSEGTYPIVALVNAGSASASEIVAGALQDQHRALVLGSTTFGKGSVQTVYPLQEGSGLRLTTALYYTPSGRSIQEVGIAPDIEFAQPERIEPAAAESEAAARIREQDLEGHFTQKDAAGKSSGEKPSEPQDAQLERAREVLKSWTYFDRFRAPAGPAPQTAEAVTPAAP